MAKLLDSKVAVFARNAKALQDLAVRAPDQVLAVPGDVIVRADLEHLVTTTVKRFGGVDVVVPNAGVTKVVSFADSEEQAIHEQFSVDFVGTLQTARLFLGALHENVQIVRDVGTRGGRRLGGTYLLYATDIEPGVAGDASL